MTDDSARRCVPLDSGAVTRPWDAPARGEPAAVTAWQALLDAGLIGGNPPTPPEVAARRAETDALFRGIARDRARLRRE